MEDKCSSNLSDDYKETLCSVHCDVLPEENQIVLNEYFEFCATRFVLPIMNFHTNELRLFGSKASNIEAVKRFLELQNELLIENTKKQKAEGIYWWYEAWDGTWQLYKFRIATEIERYYKSKKETFTLINEIGEKVSIDINKFEEIYGSRVKRIRRSKIDELQPDYWTLTPLPLEKFLLNTESEEYLSIKDNFDKTMKDRYTKLSIERIQNIRLFKLFCISHEDFIVRYGKETNGTMRFLYHGCAEAATINIIERGFNRSYCGVHGCCYGRGVYFSTDASFSDKYSPINEKKEKRMFYSRVLIGRSMIGRAQLCEPEKGYDTTTDGTHIFVCYYDSQCYPEYLLTYL